MFLDQINFHDIHDLAQYNLYWESPPDITWEFKKIILFGRQYKKNDIVLIDSNKSYIGLPSNAIKDLRQDVCLLVREGVVLDTKLPILRSKNLNAFIDILMLDKRSKYLGKVISITGSVGKTSTTRLVNNSLGIFGSTHLSIRENLRNGVFNRLNSIKNEDYSIFEVAAGGMSSIPNVLKSDVAVLLTIGEAHLERYSSLEELALHKAKIFEGNPGRGIAVINSDIPFYDLIEQKARDNHRKIITYGKDNKAVFQYLTFIGGELSFYFYRKKYTIFLDTYEDHQAVNFLASLAVLEALDLAWEGNLLKLSQSMEVEEGRGDEHVVNLQIGDIRVIDSAFNSSPLALTSILQSFNDRKVNGRKIAVLSDMLELGSESIELHKRIIDKLSEHLEIDMFLLIGNYMTSIPIKSKKIYQFPVMDDAFSFLNNNLLVNDTVLFKGSNGTGLRTKLWQCFNKSK